MVQITVKVDGMQCSMCEAHVNEAVRRALLGIESGPCRQKGFFGLFG